jgi:hypothetical protein
MRAFLVASAYHKHTPIAACERRRTLRNILVKHIHIAEVATNTYGANNDTAKWAWDVVEEVSQKLHRMDAQHKAMERESMQDVEMGFEFNEELAHRMYDV